MLLYSKVMLFYMLEQERSIKLLDPLLYWFAVLLQLTDCLLVLSDSSYLHQIIVVSQCNRIWNEQLKTSIFLPAHEFKTVLYLIHREKLQDPCLLLLLQAAKSAKKRERERDTHTLIRGTMGHGSAGLAWENQVKNSYTGIIGSVFALTNSLTLSRIIGKQ